MKRDPAERLIYEEGTWFAVPLRQGGYAVGRVARRAPEGKIILAYLFGPNRERVPTVNELDHLEPDEAVKVIRAGDLGLLDGSWPVIGDSPRWERERWPMPTFIRKEPRIPAYILGETIAPRAWRVIYSDDDPNTVVSEEQIPYETTGLAPDSLHGHKAAETYLSQILEP